METSGAVACGGRHCGAMSEFAGGHSSAAERLSAVSVERIRGVWRGLLGAPSAFQAAGCVVAVRGAGAADGGRLEVVRLADRLAVSAPPELAERIGEAVAGGLVDLTDPAVVLALVGPVAQVIGPAALAYANRGCFTPRPGSGVAMLDAGDAAVVALAEACGPEDAAESAIAELPSPVWVARADGQVVAASGYAVWSGALGQVGVLTHPRFRGRGLGRVVASAAVADALDAGLVAQWRARVTLQASRRIARSLGFVELGRQVLFRLER